MLMTITDWLWSYVLIGALLIAGVAAMTADRFFPIEDSVDQKDADPMEANA